MSDPTPNTVVEWLTEELSNQELGRRCDVFNKTWASSETLALMFATCGWSAQDTLSLFVRASGSVLDHYSEYST